MKHSLLKFSFVMSLTALTLTGCATTGTKSNTQPFLGETYTIQEASLGGNTTSQFYFTSKQNPSQMIVVERTNLAYIQQNGERFVQSWLEKEQQYRKDDCVLNKKTYENHVYYVCKFNNPNRPNAIAIYSLRYDNTNGYAKVWMNKSNANISPEQEQAIGKALYDFYIP